MRPSRVDLSTRYTRVLSIPRIWSRDERDVDTKEKGSDGGGDPIRMFKFRTKFDSNDDSSTRTEVNRISVSSFFYWVSLVSLPTLLGAIVSHKILTLVVRIVRRPFRRILLNERKSILSMTYTYMCTHTDTHTHMGVFVCPTFTGIT